MRVFTFFLMLMVATAGTLVGYRVITGNNLLNLAEFGIGAQASTVSVVAGARAVPTAVPSPPTPVVKPTAVPTAAPAAEANKIMLVGNTDGQGVYLRRTPRLGDKLQAWPDRTRMEVTGNQVDGDGRKWWKVKAPSGAEGFIPIEFLVNAP